MSIARQPSTSWWSCHELAVYLFQEDWLKESKRSFEEEAYSVSCFPVVLCDTSVYSNSIFCLHHIILNTCLLLLRILLLFICIACFLLFSTVFSCTVDVEIFMGEIFRGLNFQEIKFSWMVAPMKI